MLPIAPIRGTRLLVLALVPCWLAAAVPGAAAAMPGAQEVRAARAGDPPAPHQHVYVRTPVKVWVPPVEKQVKVGTDAQGNPVYKTQVVRPGYYKTVYVQRCSCGAQR